MNKWALVTGASSGIGAELARIYAQNHQLSFTEALSEELMGTGVSVTALCPGLTDTEMVENVQDDDALPSIPAFLISNAKGVAQEGYDAAKAQEVVRIPGLANQMTTLWVQSQPRWLVRSLGGLFGRQFMK